ncbi:MAG: S-layer family protein [Azonexus sp.]|jgi:filamentous hemagglutinin|nr:S-layer family protein [Azonexus sp.]
MNTAAHALIYSPSRRCLIPAPEFARCRGKQRRTRRNRLYHQPPGSTAHYLLETDPVFANYRTWLSSDYLLQALSLDPAQMQKRLGDGFYEQRLIAEQVAQLTGRRFLAGYADDETQYQALMAAGVSVAQAWQLIPGVALSAAQVAQLTTDIVWLVSETVTLPDGSTQQALVPRVYARLQDGDLAPSGALLAAEHIRLDSAGEFANSGAIAGRQTVLLTGEHIAIERGVVAGRDLAVQAATDLDILGGALIAQNSLVATAGRDLTVASSTAERSYAPTQETGIQASVERKVIDRVAGLYVTGENGVLVAAAGRDLAVLAAEIASAGDAALAAQRDLTLGTPCPSG